MVFDPYLNRIELYGSVPKNYFLMKIKLLSIIAILFFLSTTTHAQTAIHKQVAPIELPDSADLSFYSKKNWIMASSQIVGLNMGLWAFNRYAQKAEFAYIDINTIKANLKKGFVWDNDQMGTNMFLHPYHGNLYFNSARSNGYNFWESGAFAFGGSLMWELFLENEYPSINDIIATPIGGLALGEVLYRSSDIVLDDRATGGERVGREFAAFLITPTRGLTRMINGDTWRKRSTSGRQFGVKDISVEISSGVRALEFKEPIIDEGIGFATNINIEYGDRYEIENEKPYDYFTLRANLNLHSSQPVLGQVNILGRLYVGEIIDTEKDFLSLGLYQHFDYYDSDTISKVSNRVPYRFGTPASFGAGFIYKNKMSPKYNFDMYFHMNAILLGASLSDHYVVDMRNYNLASGFSIKAGANLAYKDKFSVSALYERYGMYTWKGYPENIDWETIDPHKFNYQGDRSRAIIHVLSLRFDLKLMRQLYLTSTTTNFIRDTRYRLFEDVSSKTTESNLMLSYRF